MKCCNNDDDFNRRPRFCYVQGPTGPTGAPGPSGGATGPTGATHTLISESK